MLLAAGPENSCTLLARAGWLGPAASIVGGATPGVAGLAILVTADRVALDHSYLPRCFHRGRTDLNGAPPFPNKEGQGAAVTMPR